MKLKEFNSLRQMKKYFNKKDNIYYFYEKNGLCFDVMFNFDVNIGNSRIEARNILNSCNITTGGINCEYIDACDIDADTIIAGDVNVCDIKAHHIEANNIIAGNIRAHHIEADTIIACDIKAAQIKYLDVCIARKDIRYEVVKSYKQNGKSIMCALDGKCIIEKLKEEV